MIIPLLYQFSIQARSQEDCPNLLGVRGMDKDLQLT